MKYEFASDFRTKAREILKGKWGIAVIAGLIYSLLGGGSAGPQVKVNIDSGHFSAGVEAFGQTIISTDGLGSELGALLAGGAIYAVLCAIVLGVVLFVLNSVVLLGYSSFNLKLYEGEEPGGGELFAYFRHWKTAAIAKLLRSIYIFLWSLLFIIPGIVANLGYSMTGYILAENPELTASEALARSKEMMYGNRWRLFCLELSFIGWDILSALTLGIGNLWLQPYKQAAFAVFYRDVSGTDAPMQTEEI